LKGNVGMFMVLADSADSVPRIVRAVDEEFRNAPVHTKTEPEGPVALDSSTRWACKRISAQYLRRGDVYNPAGNPANTWPMSSANGCARWEFSRTLGFTREAILGMILARALLLALVGGALGLVLASILCSFVRRAPAFIGQLKTLSIQPQVALSVSRSAAIGLVSSFVPAWGAARTPIVEALRQKRLIARNVQTHMAVRSLTTCEILWSQDHTIMTALGIALTVASCSRSSPW